MREIIFVCFTTYQLLIAMYYAYNIKNVKKILIFRDFANYNMPVSYYNKYFDKIFIIPYFENKNIIVKQIYKSYYAGYLFKISYIYNYIMNINNSVVVFFSDQEVVSNKIIYILKKEKSNCILLLEEGLGIYENEKTEFSIKTKIGNLLCGLKTCELIGECNFHDGLIVRKPELIPGRLCNNGIIIKQNDLFIDKDFIDSIVIEDERIKENNKKRLIILGEPISELHIEDSEYLESLEKIIEIYGDNYDIFIKPHPRENTEIYKGLNKCVLLDDIKWLPVELIVIKYKFDVLINIYSSSVVNIAKIKPNLEIFLIYKLYGIELNAELTEAFNKCANIIAINDYKDLIITDKSDIHEMYDKNNNYDLNYIDSLINKYDKE